MIPLDPGLVTWLDMYRRARAARLAAGRAAAASDTKEATRAHRVARQHEEAAALGLAVAVDNRSPATSSKGAA